MAYYFPIKPDLKKAFHLYLFYLFQQAWSTNHNANPAWAANTAKATAMQNPTETVQPVTTATAAPLFPTRPTA